MLNILFLFLFACNDYMMSKKVVEEPPIEEGSPEIMVIPTEINYGHLISGQQTGAKTVTVVNTGDATLAISNITIDDGDGFFLSAINDPELEPGESGEFELVYLPQTYEERAVTITIFSNDEDEQILEIPVVGFGDAPVIVANPVNETMTDVEVGCEDEIEVEITNAGNIDLEVSGLVHSATTPVDMEYINENGFPIVIPPTESRFITVRYAPDDLVPDTSEIAIHSNDPNNAVLKVYQHGTAIYVQTYTETHLQEEVVKTDIIFVIDNSGSMSVYQNEVANNMSTFMNVFVTLGIDYQIAVITTDKGYFIGPVVDPSSTDPVADVAAQITSAGVNGSAMERGLQKSYDVTQPYEDAGPNSSFLRPDALLVFVYISDERDWSSGNWTDYANYFNTLKGDPSMVLAHAVSGDYPSGCTWTDPVTGWSRPVQYGAGYYDIVQYYGGSYYSLCATDWGQQMQSLALNSIQVLEYPLDEEGVIESSISVTVEGQSNSAWSYDSDDNSIIFPQADAPAEGEEIEITYAIYGCQEEDSAQ